MGQCLKDRDQMISDEGLLLSRRNQTLVGNEAKNCP